MTFLLSSGYLALPIRQGNRCVSSGVSRTTSPRRMNRVRPTSRALVWTIAILVILQGMPGVVCPCAAHAAMASDQRLASKERPACCGACRREASPPVATSHSCCRQANSATTKGSCSCSAACQCAHRESAPTSDQVPVENRARPVEQIVQPIATLLLDCGDPQVNEPDGRQAILLAGSDCCVLLCRFHL